MDGREPERAEPSRRWVAAVVLIALISGGLVASELFSPDPTSDPRSFTTRGEPQRTGVVSTVDVDVPVGIDWRVDLGLVAGGPFGLIDTDGTATAVDSVLGLTVIDHATGEVMWHRDQGGLRPPIVGSDLVVSQTHDEVFAFDRDSGTQRWRRWMQGSRTVREVGGLVVLAGRPGQSVDAVRPDGSTAWSIPMTRMFGPSVWDVHVAGKILVIVGNSPAGSIPDPGVNANEIALFGVEAATGRVRWTRPLPNVAALPSLTTTSRHVLYRDPFAGSGETVVLDAADGKEVFREGAAIRPLILREGVLVSADGSGRLSGRDLRSGGVAWRRDEGPVLQNEATFSVVADRFIAVVEPQLTDDRRDVARWEVTVFEAATGATVTTVQVGGAQAWDVDQEGRIVTIDALLRAQLLAPDGTVTWTAGVPGMRLPAPAVGPDGTVFAMTGTGLVALDGATGASRFAFQHGQEIAGDLRVPWLQPSPVVGEQAVVISPTPLSPAPSQGLLALDRRTGVQLWSRAEDRIPPSGELTLGQEDENELVFVGAGTEIHGHDLRTGRRAFAARGSTERGPIALTDELLISTPERLQQLLRVDDPALWSEVVATRRIDRSQVWQQSVAGLCTGPTIVGTAVMVGTVTGVVAFDLNTGEQRWQAPVTNTDCLDLASADGVVVVGTDAGLTLLDAENGTERATVALGALTTAPVIAGQAILVGTGSELVAISTNDGEEEWRFTLPSPAASAPVVSGSGLLLTTRDGELLRLG